MKKIFLIFGFIIVSILIEAQSLLNINLRNSCKIDVTDTTDAQVYGFKGSAKATEIVKRLCDAVSLQPNFEIFAASVENAEAVMYNEQRYILYSEAYLTSKINSTGTYWTAIFIFAHEIAHHLNGHALNNLGSRPSDELAADKWAGFVMHKMGASLDETQAWVKTCSKNGDLVHPPRNARLEAVTIGWNQNDDFSIGKNDGIITDPKTPEDHYHNARMFEINGDIKNAKESYRHYFESNQQFIDPHIFYQELLKHSDGIEETKRIYQKYYEKNSTSPLFRYLYARLSDRTDRVNACKKIYSYDTTYMPVIYQLIIDYSRTNVVYNTINSRMYLYTMLKNFKTLNRNNSFLKYHIDKKEALKAIEYVDETLKISERFDTSVIKSIFDVSAEVYNKNHVSLSITIWETPKQIWYKIDSMPEFKTTGFSGIKKPDGSKYPNYGVTLGVMTPGLHWVYVKYQNEEDEIMGPFKRELIIPTKAMQDLQIFYDHHWNESKNKEVWVRYYRKTASFYFINISAFNSIFESIWIECDSPKYKKEIFSNGKNINGRDDASSFDFEDFKPGHYIFYFTFKCIDKRIIKLKCEIDITDSDEEYHIFNIIEL